ncbi:Scr1 family TA system antitoxin-like transcriptional regulator [Micromonospora sp. NPDC048830]|uniref:Scr1 family TA system antitoxin-like transcriptional regulator n=1 Tax=Micromonospora sp. NPDC048830 TaxID=3364257 RepID=UPI00371DA6D8
MNHAVVEAMAAAGATAESLAAQIGVDPKTVARWANPGRIPQSRHRAQVAAVLGREIADLWPDALRRREPVWFRPWLDIEREAVALRAYQLAWVPGLLQTEAYARATLAWEALTPTEVDELVSARIARQKVLTRSRGPLFVAVMDEQVIRRAVTADRSLMATQLAQLVTWAELPNVQLHIVPGDAPAHPGLNGPFTLAELPGGTRAAHVDSQARAQIIDQASDLATLERRWERIRGEALPRGRSLDILREAAASWT